MNPRYDLLLRTHPGVIVQMAPALSAGQVENDETISTFQRRVGNVGNALASITREP